MRAGPWEILIFICLLRGERKQREREERGRRDRRRERRGEMEEREEKRGGVGRREKRVQGRGGKRRVEEEIPRS